MKIEQTCFEQAPPNSSPETARNKKQRKIIKAEARTQSEIKQKFYQPAPLKSNDRRETFISDQNYRSSTIEKIRKKKMEYSDGR